MSQIAEIQVDKLFGYLDYHIPLNQADRITIIHGPNGSGKTWMLRLISYVFALDLAAIRAAPFGRVRFRFRDGGLLTIEKEVDDRQAPLLGVESQVPNDISSRVSFRYESKRTKEPKQYRSALRRAFPSSLSIERHFPQLNRVGPREWFDASRNEVLSFDRVMEIYGGRFARVTESPPPDWLIDVTKRVSVSFIQSQRLIRVPSARGERPERPGSPQRDTTDMVELFSLDIADRISKALTQSGLIAQSKDRTFPSRLLKGDFPIVPSEAELRKQLAQIDAKRQTLAAAGVLEQEESVRLPQEKINDIETRVLSLYLQDVQEKLRVFDDLEKRISILMRLINSKINPQGKRMVVNRTRGFEFIAERANGKALRPSQLSSGEQHELVLLYELLFRAQSGFFILIDEPEISLNVGWQRRFLEDLSDVVRVGGHYVLMATHSPQVINNRWDLAVALAGGVDK